MTLLGLLSNARTAGFEIDRDADGLLRIRGPRTAETLARALLARKAEVLTAVHVWNGRAGVLDWRHARVLDNPWPCVLCGARTLLLDPWDGEPMHKSCAEAAIRQRNDRDTPPRAA
jgi:hypothetical protein